MIFFKSSYLTKKLNPRLIEKYDISQKVLKEFADLESRHILFSIIKEPKRAQDISHELKIPLSSVYKKIKSLNKCSLILQKRKLMDNGHIAIFYQSLIKNVKITITKFEPSISFSRNGKIRE